MGKKIFTANGALMLTVLAGAFGFFCGAMTMPPAQHPALGLASRTIRESVEMGPWARRYPAWIVSIYDGDTVTLDIEMGLDTMLTDQRVRLQGLDAAEVRGEDKAQGLVARDALRAKLGNDRVILETWGERGKYGRLIGVLWHRGANVNEWLVESGYATTYEDSGYGKDTGVTVGVTAVERVAGDDG